MNFWQNAYPMMSKTKGIAVNIFLIIISLLFISFIFEGIVRFFFPQPLNYFAFPNQIPKPGTKLKIWDIDVYYNSYGFRDYDYELSNKNGATRIVVIGDSITFGNGVRIEDTYHKKLETLLNSNNVGHYEVPTANLGGSDLEWQIKIYKDIVRNWESDIVILGFCLNDFLDYERYNHRNSDIITITSLRKKVLNFITILHSWARLNFHSYFLIFERSRRLFYKYIFDIRRKRPDSFYPLKPNSENFHPIFDSTLEKIKQLHDMVTHDGSRFIVVIFPYEMQLSPEHVRIYEEEFGLYGYQDAPKGTVQSMLSEHLRRNGIEFVDLLAAFQAAYQREPDQPLYFRNIGGMLDWVHPNAHGHEIAAREIAAYLLGGESRR